MAFFCKQQRTCYRCVNLMYRLRPTTPLTRGMMDETYFKSKEYRERTSSVTSFYDQSAIDQVAAKPSVRLTPSSLLYGGHSHDKSHLLRSAQYLYKELPVRLAHRIEGFRNLPFIVGCNSTILKVHEMYILAFHTLYGHGKVMDMESEKVYSETLATLLDQHKDVITLLAQGFSESRKHIKDEQLIQAFLDRTLKSRLGIRVLAQHHLAMHNEQSNHVGIIDVSFTPRVLLESSVEFLSKLCRDRYGCAPNVQLLGHMSVQFPYMPQPVEYIVGEVMKNAMRATVEKNRGNYSNIPDVVVTVANNNTDFIIKVSDRGGGIPHDIVDKVWNYNYTTAYSLTDDQEQTGGIFGEVMSPAGRAGESVSRMHGYGFGLPTARAYAEFLGGRITLETMQGIGTDVYIRLSHIDSISSINKPNFRI
ncbi:3-methyl-2-oxobutanoate dehydrogenase [lipoamide] kinase, mitochondrial-like [Mizuhopecten yessoensis]|uniref:Protein-serine/threonine kinase n=1 Tax=Mizuhopecten yessoensis TaxID=6573 RepID=A0A210QCU7_MIZYE|nr:3-methyl-2-oxobutanoate dehydrogenase [lipoamide] kinase, mitochondrial-like [Mizuhopecten yessoensis]OWF46554.1 [3-methyl-2-oxobutanoate dehydrogenase [lipoamide]] kinase, mitochondrial [Mizuhopecten yessoensis]